MTDEFTGLAERLAELADAPAPASPFDAARTAAAGRRRVLSRRGSAVGGGGVLAVAAVVGIVLAFAPGARSRSVASAPPGDRLDPLITVVDFGWLPASLPNVSYTATADGGGDTAIAQGEIRPQGEPRVDLRLLAGDGPGTASPGERMIPTRLDDGRQAFWVTQSPGGGRLTGVFQLRFPADDDHWASMDWSADGNQADVGKIAGVPTTAAPSSSGMDSAPPASVPASAQWQRDLLHMASQVTVTPRLVPLPLRLTGLPPDLRPGTAFLWRPGDFGKAAPGTWSALLMFYSGKLTASVDVGPHGTLAETAPPVAEGTECATSAGLDVCVQYSGSSPAFSEIGGAKGLLKLVTLLGPDERDWTTEVIVP